MWWIQLDTEATIIGRIIQFELCRGEIATEARNDEKNRKRRDFQAYRNRKFIGNVQWKSKEDGQKYKYSF